MERFKRYFFEKLKKESLALWLLLIFSLIVFNEYLDEKNKANECFKSQIDIFKVEVRELFDQYKNERRRTLQ